MSGKAKDLIAATVLKTNSEAGGHTLLISRLTVQLQKSGQDCIGEIIDAQLNGREWGTQGIDPHKYRTLFFFDDGTWQFYSPFGVSGCVMNSLCNSSSHNLTTTRYKYYPTYIYRYKVSQELIAKKHYKL